MLIRVAEILETNDARGGKKYGSRRCRVNIAKTSSLQQSGETIQDGEKDWRLSKRSYNAYIKSQLQIEECSDIKGEWTTKEHGKQDVHP